LLIDNLRRQHDDATAMAMRLRELADLYSGDDDAFPIALQLARFHALLRLHLVEEDHHLYPWLMALDDPGASALAKTYQRKMGSLAWDVETFMRHWSSSAMIAVDFASFKRALATILSALGDRIARENAILYPLADAASRSRQSKAA